MKIWDLAELAGRNLKESKLRSGLTTMGIAVGVASLVAMLALGVGLQEMASKRLGKSGLFETVVVTSRQDFRTPRNTGGESSAGAKTLDEKARSAMEALPNVVEVHPEIRIMTEVRFGETPHFATVGGMPMSAQDNEAFTDMKGRYFSSAEAEEAILHREFAKELSKENPESVIGQQLVLRYAERQPMENGDGFGFSVVRRERPLTVVGLIETEPFGGMRSVSRAGVLVPIEMAENLNIMQAADLSSVMRTESEGRTYMSLLVRVNTPGAVGDVQRAIDGMGFRTFSILDATRGLRRFFVVLDLFLGIFGSLALAVASLGIVNTLVMAILERRREIGIMKAIGASDGDVKKIFFAEAGVMGLLGGALGIALAWLMGLAINYGTTIYLRQQQLPPETISTVPLWLAAGALGFAVLVSLAAGLYPAARAARLDPVQALRYD